MRRAGASLIHLLSLAGAIFLPLGSVGGVAQTPTPPSGASIPRKLTLAQAEQLLLERNLSVLAAKYQVSANRAAKLIASFKPNPTLTLGAEQFPIYSPLSGSFPRFFKTNSDAGANPVYTVRYDYLVERGGKRELRTELAESQLQASEAQMLDAARLQLYQLRQAFTSATLARENLLLAEATNQQYEQTIKLTAAKVENGDLAGIELYRAQAAALQYQQAIQQARTTYEQATRDILNILGARAEDVQAAQVADGETERQRDGETEVVKASFTPDSRTAQRLGDELLEVDFNLDDQPIGQAPEELRRIALAERPDVIAAHRLYDAALKGTFLARAQRVRDVSVGSFVQRVGSDVAVGANVSIPLFTHNKGFAAISQAEAQKDAAAALMRQVELQAVTDVEKAYLAYRSARRTLDIYNSTTLERAGKLKAIATVSYKEGASNLLELLDAQRTYNQTINSYNQARADYQMALWQLEQAIGKPLR